MNLGIVKIYAEWPWNEDHRHHGCPVQFTVHTRNWVLMLRPFSSFAQGGRRRGDTARRAWRDAGRQGPEPVNPWERAQEACWVLEDENPEIWERLGGRGRRRRSRRGRRGRQNADG